jgi:hypothetical protein
MTEEDKNKEISPNLAATSPDVQLNLRISTEPTGGEDIHKSLFDNDCKCLVHILEPKLMARYALDC